MKYLAPNSLEKIEIPVIVGAEYTFPIAEPLAVIRTDGVTTNKDLKRTESSTITLELQTPDVLSGGLKVINTMVTVQTPIGLFRFRENFGVIDLLDIPTTGDDVRLLFGLTSAELQDTEMDIEGKYLKLYPLLINNFHTLRATQPYLEKLFGDLIALVEALALLPSLVVRLDKKRATENGDVTRLGDAKDLITLSDALGSKYADLMEELKDYFAESTPDAISILQFVNMYNFATGGKS